MEQRPTGTVTFLFTDVEGSTRKWDQATTAMADALARHDEALRTAIAAHGGVVFATGGDGVAAAFQTAPAALGAAVDAQRALAGVDWNDVPELRVRMGLHTGTAEERGGDYFGPTLNRCARLMAIAHGGQVVCSGATAELVAGALPDGASLVDHGEHRLKDLERPEHVHEVRLEGGESFPALRSLDRRLHNLPVMPTSFLGREDEITAIAKLLDEHRLIVLTGIGGSGKTRLSLEVAARESDRYRDGVWFVDLAPVTDERDVANAIGKAIGVLLTTDDPHAEVVPALAGMHALVVLDNCEHLVDECAALAEDVLLAGPTCTILATSREAFGVEGEHVWPVRPLEVGEDGRLSPALQLFAERATAARPDFGLDDAVLPAVVEICERLDGLPLAIELAAARVAHLPPAEIAARLGDRFRLLTGTRRRVQRQQTLQAAMEWSYGLLSDDERVLLRRLAVFVGPFSLAAAEGVCADDPLSEWQVVDLLSSLVNKSLVVAEVGSEARFRLLETVRLFAETQLLESGEAESLRDRHATWFAGWLESVPLETRVANATQYLVVESAWPNIRAAVDWRLDHEDFGEAARLLAGAFSEWIWGGRNREGESLLTAVALHLDDVPADVRGCCLAGLLNTEMLLGSVGARDHARKAARTVGDTPLAILVHGFHALFAAPLVSAEGAQRRVGETLAAIADIERAARGHGPGWQQLADAWCSMVQLYLSDWDGALHTAQRALARGRSVEFAVFHDVAAATAAAILHARRRPSEAVTALAVHLDDALAFPTTDEDPVAAYVAVGMGSTAVAALCASGRVGDAFEYTRWRGPQLQRWRAAEVYGMDAELVLSAGIIAAAQDRWRDAGTLVGSIIRDPRTGRSVRSPQSGVIWHTYEWWATEKLAQDVRQLRVPPDEAVQLARSILDA